MEKGGFSFYEPGKFKKSPGWDFEYFGELMNGAEFWFAVRVSLNFEDFFNLNSCLLGELLNIPSLVTPPKVNKSTKGYSHEMAFAI